MTKGKLRTRYFIKGSMQGKLIATFLILITLGGIAFTAIFSIFAVDTFTFIHKTYGIEHGKTSFILIKELIKEHWLIIIVGNIIIIIAATILTHRFAGPMLRFERTLEDMMKGSLYNEIKLRKNDEGKELARMINQFNEKLSNDLTEIGRISDDIRKSTSQISQSFQKEGKEKPAEIEALSKLNNRLKEVVNRYQVKNQKDA